MADCVVSPANITGFNEAVCIDATRIYDSCSDKDCLEDLQVYVTCTTQAIIDCATAVRSRSVEILNVFLEVEPVPFNRGFYSVDMTFYFKIRLDVYQNPITPPIAVDGLCIFSKKCVLFGSEGNVKTFSSADQFFGCCREASHISNLPMATVQVVDPLVLSCKLVDGVCLPPQAIPIPPSVACQFDGEFTFFQPDRVVTATLGIFSIVQMSRRAQLLVPTYELSLPEKVCVTTSDDPCDLFSRVKFPMAEFFPPTLDQVEEND